MNRVALVSGASRGIGLEVCRQLATSGMKVILTSKDQNEGIAAQKSLAADGIAVAFHQLDIIDESSIEAAYQYVLKTYGRLDTLINNAAISKYESYSSLDPENTIMEGELSTIQQCFENNTLGSLRMSQKFGAMMLNQNYGRIVNVSSGSGQLSTMESGWPGYRISKAALNAVTKMLAIELKPFNILVNSVCPGQVSTELSGWRGSSTAEGADTIVWAASLNDDGPTGGFFRNRKLIDW